MGVFTHLTHDQLATLLARFLHESLLHAHGVSAGSVNTYYQITTPTTSLYLRIDERPDPHHALSQELCLLSSLRAHPDLRVPSAHRTLDDQPWTHHQGKPALLFDALDGASIPRPELTPEHLRSLARWLAAAHSIPPDDSLATHRFHPDHLLHDLFLPHRDALHQLHPEGVAAIDEIFLDRSAKPYRFDHLPQAIIHADLFPDNLLFLDDSLHAVLDFEAAGRGPRYLDLAIATHALCFDESPPAPRLIHERAPALLDEYVRHIPPTPAEREAWPALCRYAATRFLVTRLRDFELFFNPTSPDATWYNWRDYLTHLRTPIPALPKSAV
jgi:homoserine kinase type II